MTKQEFSHTFECGFRQTVRRLMRRGVDRAAAEELTQEAWVKAWERLGQLRDPGRIVGWVLRIAFNLLRDEERTRKELRESLLEGQLVVPQEISRVNIEASRALDRCPLRYRPLIEQLYLEGYSQREMANKSGKTLAAIRGAAYRARRAIRENMAA